MKNIKSLVALFYSICLSSCVNTEYKSKEHSNKIDFSQIDQKIDSIQTSSYITECKIYRKIHTIDSIFYKGTGKFKIEQNKYDEIKRFQYASTKIEREIYDYTSQIISRIENVMIEQSDTLQPHYMRNRGDKTISYKYSNKNVFALSAKIKSFLIQHKIKNQPDFDKFEKEILNKEITFDDRYFILKILINQIKEIEYEYFEDAIDDIK